MPAPFLLLLAMILSSLPLPSSCLAEEVPAAAVKGVVRFHDANPHRVHLNLAPEGNKPLVWMLDTGAQDSVMTPALARAAGISVRRTKSSPYRRKTRVGRSVQFWIDYGISDQTSLAGWDFAVLGGEFLEEFVVEIDLPARQVRFLDPKRYRVPEQPAAPNEHVLPMRVVAKRPFVDITVNGVETAVLFDTGAPPGLVLSGRSAEAAGVSWEGGFPMSFGTTRGPTEARLVERVPVGLDLAGQSERPSPVLVTPNGWYNIAGNTDSVMGLDAVRDYLIRLDYPRRRLWLRRKRERAPTFYGVPWDLTRAAGLQLAFLQDARFQVLGVEEGSAAIRLGLRAGDEPVTKEPEIEEFLRRVSRGGPVSIRRGGALLELSAAGE